MINKFYSFLSLCMKAGKLVSGSELCERLIRDGKATLVIIAGDASENTKKKFRDKCSYYQVEYIIVGNKEILGNYTGKSERTVMAVTDINFKSKMIELAEKEINQMEVGMHGED